MSRWEDLADVLIETAPAGLDRVYFVSGGSEAVEAWTQAGAPVCSRARATGSAATSLPDVRATTATRWAHWQPAATNGGVSSSDRC